MQKHKKLLIALGVVLGLLGAFAFYRLALDWGGVPGKLYQYYPASTGFYLELAPGGKLTKRFIAFLDEQAAREEKEALQREKDLKAKQATLKAEQSDLKSEESQPNSASNANQAEDPEKSLPVSEKQSNKSVSPVSMQATSRPKNFRRVFLRKFNSTFEPYFSLGIWANPDLAGTGLEANGGHTLVILPLKENLTLPQVIQRFDLDLKDFKQQSLGKQPYFSEKESGTSLAILNRKLLITNTPQAMHSALSHSQKNEESNVFTEPHNQAYLSQLSWFRQGTFILNNTVYTRNALAKASRATSQIAGMGDILPLTVGSIQANMNQRLTLRFITPLQLKNIPDKKLRASLQGIVQPAQAFPQINQLPDDTGMMFGVAGLDKVYDFYREFIMPAGTGRWVQMLGIVLSGFRVDFRDDIVSLLAQRSVMASRLGKQPSLVMVLEKSEQKDKSLNKISTLLSTNVFPMKLAAGQVENVAVKTLSLPIPMPGLGSRQLQYGTVGDDLVFATPRDFEAVVAVSQRKQKSLIDNTAYRSVMDGLPSRNNAVAYVNYAEQRRTNQVGKYDPGQWVSAVGLALELTDQPKDGATVLNGQINLKLAEPKSQK